MRLAEDWAAGTGFHARSGIPGRTLRSETWTDTRDWPDEWIDVTTKGSTRLPSVELAGTAPCGALGDLLTSRGSTRVPGAERLATPELGAVLRYGLGLRTGPEGRQDVARRVQPSAGARFPVEAYLVAARCADVEEGRYRYDVPHHRLDRLTCGPVTADLERIFGHPWIARSRAVVVLTAALGRTAVKYSERGYRFALLEAGHIAQNMLLTAQQLGVPATPVGGFADACLDRFLDLRKAGELSLYAVVLP